MYLFTKAYTRLLVRKNEGPAEQRVVPVSHNGRCLLTPPATRHPDREGRWGRRGAHSEGLCTGWTCCGSGWMLAG